MAVSQGEDEGKMDLRVATIIPFFQRKKNILRKAVLSALNQKSETDNEIIIVDDASPVKAKEELNDLLTNKKMRIRLIELEENRGPGFQSS